MALIVIGLSLPMITAIRLSVQGSPTTTAPTVAHLVMVFSVIGLTLLSLSPGASGRNLRPLRVVGPVLAAFGTATTIVIIIGPSADSPHGMGMPVFRLGEWAATAMWLGLAVAFVRPGRRHHRSTQLWRAASLGLMAAAELARALSLSGPVRLVEFSSGLQLSAAGFAACAAAVQLYEALRVTELRTDRLTGDLIVVRTGLLDTEQRELERLHDARTAMTGLMGASRLLAGSDPDHALDRLRLRDMMVAELGRVGALLEPHTGFGLSRFRISDAIAPVVIAHRLAGVDVRLETDDHWAVGSAVATATAVANLLSNAAQHAPGSKVVVSAVTVGPASVIRVTDDGPGIPPDERGYVLRSGFRGSTARGRGSGFGLFTAARAMADQGGTLEFVRVDVGTSVMLTLPASTAVADTGTSEAATAPSRRPLHYVTTPTPAHV